MNKGNNSEDCLNTPPNMGAHRLHSPSVLRPIARPATSAVPFRLPIKKRRYRDDDDGASSWSKKSSSTSSGTESWDSNSTSQRNLLAEPPPLKRQVVCHWLFDPARSMTWSSSKHQGATLPTEQQRIDWKQFSFKLPPSSGSAFYESYYNELDIPVHTLGLNEKSAWVRHGDHQQRFMGGSSPAIWGDALSDLLAVGDHDTPTQIMQEWAPHQKQQQQQQPDEETLHGTKLLESDEDTSTKSMRHHRRHSSSAAAASSPSATMRYHNSSAPSFSPLMFDEELKHLTLSVPSSPRKKMNAVTPSPVPRASATTVSTAFAGSNTSCYLDTSWDTACFSPFGHAKNRSQLLYDDDDDQGDMVEEEKNPPPASADDHVKATAAEFAAITSPAAGAGGMKTPSPLLGGPQSLPPLPSPPAPRKSKQVDFQLPKALIKQQPTIQDVMDNLIIPPLLRQRPTKMKVSSSPSPPHDIDVSPPRLSQMAQSRHPLPAYAMHPRRHTVQGTAAASFASVAHAAAPFMPDEPLTENLLRSPPQLGRLPTTLLGHGDSGGGGHQGHHAHVMPPWERVRGHDDVPPPPPFEPAAPAFAPRIHDGHHPLVGTGSSGRLASAFCPEPSTATGKTKGKQHSRGSTAVDECQEAPAPPAPPTFFSFDSM